MDFQDAMAIGKANAKRDRDRGGSSVRVYATSKAMYAARGGNVGVGTWEHSLAEARAPWQSTREQAIADLEFALWGDELEGFEL